MQQKPAAEYAVLQDFWKFLDFVFDFVFDFVRLFWDFVRLFLGLDIN